MLVYFVKSACKTSIFDDTFTDLLMTRYFSVIKRNHGIYFFKKYPIYVRQEKDDYVSVCMYAMKTIIDLLIFDTHVPYFSNISFV